MASYHATHHSTSLTEWGHDLYSLMYDVMLQIKSCEIFGGTKTALAPVLNIPVPKQPSVVQNSLNHYFSGLADFSLFSYTGYWVSPSPHVQEQQPLLKTSERTAIKFAFTALALLENRHGSATQSYKNQIARLDGATTNHVLWRHIPMV